MRMLALPALVLGFSVAASAGPGSSTAGPSSLDLMDLDVLYVSAHPDDDMAVLGTFARIHNRRHDETVAAKKAELPAVGAQGTLARGGAGTALCDVPKNAFFFSWPCHSQAKTLPAESKVRVMKAGMSGSDAVCRYWVQSGPLENAAGDAPCDWFVAQ